MRRPGATPHRCCRRAPPGSVAVDRFRVDPHGIEAQELAVERRDVVAPQRPHRRDVFRGARRAALGHPEASNSSRPADADSEREPATAERVQRRRLLGHQHRVVFRQQQHPGRDTDCRRRRGGEAEPDHRVDPVGGGRHRDLPVVGIRVAGLRSIHHHDVLTRPQRGKPAPFRGGATASITARLALKHRRPRRAIPTASGDRLTS